MRLQEGGGGGGVRTSKTSFVVFWTNVTGGIMKVDWSRSSPLHPYSYSASSNNGGRWHSYIQLGSSSLSIASVISHAYR